MDETFGDDKPYMVEQKTSDSAVIGGREQAVRTHGHTVNQQTSANSGLIAQSRAQRVAQNDFGYSYIKDL